MGPCSLFLVLKASHFEFRIARLQKLLTHGWIVYVGSISYGIYLFHVPIGALFGEYIFDPLWSAIPFGQFGPLEKVRWHSWLIKFPLYTTLVIAVAAASYKWFELPILRLKDRWFRYETGRNTTQSETTLPLSAHGPMAVRRPGRPPDSLS